MKSELKKEITLLLAMPSLNEDPFRRSVIAMVEKPATGDLGLIVSKSSGKKISEFFSHPEVPMPKIFDNCDLTYGGPVNSDYFLAIHRLNKIYPSTFPINSEIGFSLVNDMIPDFSKEKAPEVFQFNIGYSGWIDGQLEDEIEDGSWWKTTFPAQELFQIPPEERYEKVFQKMGVNPDELIVDDSPGNPTVH